MSGRIYPVAFNYMTFMNIIKEDVLNIFMVKADWCGPCKMIMPRVVELSINYPSVNFHWLNIDDDANHEIIEYLAPTKVPTFYIIKNGICIETIVGTNVNKLEDLINRYL